MLVVWQTRKRRNLSALKIPRSGREKITNRLSNALSFATEREILQPKERQSKLKPKK